MLLNSISSKCDKIELCFLNNCLFVSWFEIFPLYTPNFGGFLGAEKAVHISFSYALIAERNKHNRFSAAKDGNIYNGIHMVYAEDPEDAVIKTCCLELELNLWCICSQERPARGAAFTGFSA